MGELPGEQEREQERESAGPRQYHVASAEGGGVLQVEGVTVPVVEVDVVVEVEVMVVVVDVVFPLQTSIWGC